MENIVEIRGEMIRFYGIVDEGDIVDEEDLEGEEELDDNYKEWY
jgi:hypothetical protein